MLLSISFFLLSIRVNLLLPNLSNLEYFRDLVYFEVYLTKRNCRTKLSAFDCAVVWWPAGSILNTYTGVLYSSMI